ncbi:MAG TPA: polysaccharide biosynthesis/export family protein [Thermoanaerobaculia bacterium]
MKHIGFFATLFFALLLPHTAGAQSPAASPGYRIGPRDLLDVRVFESQQLTGEVRVSEGGAAVLPLVGEVPVAGLTEAEAAQKIKEVLESKLLQRASVSVRVSEFRSRPISVIGAVRQPGSLAFSGRWTLIEALTAAGGLDEGHGGQVHVLRRADNGLADQVSVAVDDLLARADPRVNLPIFAGDLINVPAATDVTVYCLGEVEQPGAVSFRSSSKITLLAVIARAGGLTDRAASKILIRRSGSAQGEIRADYKRILAGKESDPELQGGDIVVVKESFF